MSEVKLNELLGKLDVSTKNLASECKDVSDWLTDHPELPGEEKASSEYVMNFLREKGYYVEPTYYDVPYSFRAVKKSEMNVDKPRVAILCEYDGLPDIGHACGHSLSCGISLLTALAISEAFQEFPFKVELVGTPDEELRGGKVMMVDRGGFKEYEFAIMAHMASKNIMNVNPLACTDMLVTFHGKSAHASEAPWEGVNALNATQLMMHAFDMLRQHLKPECQIHGIITNGGSVTSIVPETSSAYFNPRAKNIKELNVLWDKLSKCAEGAAIATGCTCEIESLHNTFLDVYNSEESLSVSRDVFESLGLPYTVQERPYASTDIGNVDSVIPVFHPWIAVGDGSADLHYPEFAEMVRKEEAIDSLINGANVIGGIISLLAFDPNRLNDLKNKHKQYRDSLK